MDYSLIIYIIFSSISILLGMLFFQNKEKSILFFIFLGLILPTSPQFMFVTSYQGVYFYDYYFLLLAIYYLVNVDFKKLKNIILNNRLVLFTTTTLLLYYTYLICLNSISFDKYLLRDFRPVLLLVYGFIFIQLLRSIKIDMKTILNILLYSLILKIIFFIILFILDPFQDPYYQSSLFRYRDGLTFISALFLVIFIYKKNLIRLEIPKVKLNIVISLTILILVMSNQRILLIAMLPIYLFNKGILDNLGKKLMISLIIISSFIGYTYVMTLFQYNLHTKAKTILVIKDLEEKKVKQHRIDRQKSKLSKDYTSSRYNSLFQNLNKQLYIRFSPALDHIKEMKLVEFFVGKGFATTFEREYFKYRGLDVKSNKIDSTYLTFFVKYGLVGLVLLLFLFFQVLFANVFDYHLKLNLVLFYLILFLVVIPFYQSGTIFQLVFVNLIMGSLVSVCQNKIEV